MGLKIRSDEPRMCLDAIEHAGQKPLFQAVIAQPPDRGYRDHNQ
jgi:hypothetical protein